MVKVFNASNIGEERLKRNGYAQPIIFSGSAQENLRANSMESFGKAPAFNAKACGYEGSEAQVKVCERLEDAQKKINAVQTPSAQDIQNLLGLYLVDVTRKTMEAPDLTSFLATETTNLNDPEAVTLQNVLKYRGIMGKVKGNGEAVNMIQPATAVNDTMMHEIYAVGYETSLRQLVYDPFYDNMKVTQAAVDADTDARNNAIIGAIVGATYKTKQTQAADSTANATFDVKVYNTLRDAYNKKLKNLLDPQTKRKISTPRVALLCNSADTWGLQRVINGQLQGSNGTTGVQNMQPLPIADIYEYDHGINDGFTIGKDVASFPGVAAGTCYMFVPKEYLFVRNKRPLTLETSRGSALTLSQDAKAWYRIFGVHMKDFMGSAFPGTSLPDGYGAIVKITLPS